MEEITRETWEFLSGFATLEDFITHKFEKIKELRIERSDIENKLNKLRIGEWISSDDFQKHECLIKDIKHIEFTINRFQYYEYIYNNYFRERCGV